MLSIIIPAYNEEKYLGRLLRIIKEQTVQPGEIIVADNNSTDKTVVVARKFGCRIVKGGNPAVGRTAGAKASSGDILLFLDADLTFKEKNFLKRILDYFRHRQNSIATVWFVSQDKNLLNKLVCLIANLTKRLNLIIARKWKTIIGDYGIFILCPRSIFEKVGGFPSLKGYQEDTLFFRKAVKNGAKYTVLPEKIFISGRRLKNKSIFRLLFWAALCALVIILSFLKLRVNNTILKWYEEMRKGR